MSEIDIWKKYSEKKIIGKGKIDEIQKINLDNIVKIEEIIELKNKLYIIMDLCSIDLNNYLLSRDKPLSINELKEILFQLNNIFKN